VTPRAELDAILDTFEAAGGDEIAVMLVRARRLAVGLRGYGPLDVNDGRCWRKERAEELVDAEVYGDFELVRIERVRQDVATLERLRADLAAPVEANPIEAAKERLRAGPFKAKYAEDVERAKERGAVEMERFEVELPDEERTE
jgi:hypothetical protein